MPIICGKSDYYLNWYHRICKVTPRLMEAKRKRDSKYYYANRFRILAKSRQKRLEKNPNLKTRKWTKYKELKPSEEKKFRKRNGYYEPIIHQYPKNRRSMSKVYSDGVVV